MEVLLYIFFSPEKRHSYEKSGQPETEIMKTNPNVQQKIQKSTRPAIKMYSPNPTHGFYLWNTVFTQISFFDRLKFVCLFLIGNIIFTLLLCHKYLSRQLTQLNLCHLFHKHISKFSYCCKICLISCFQNFY